MKRALFIAGPTASGKSAFALKAASALNGIIINADSMQVYRDLSVLTACPSKDEQEQAPHRLYGFLDGAEVCSAALWAERAYQEIGQAWREGKMPVLVGGTGMYFKVLVDGIAKIPDIPEEIRHEVRAECREHGSLVLHSELSRVDPETAARLAPGDGQRVSRAVEVYRATKIPLSDWHQNTQVGPMFDADRQGFVDKVILAPERDLLYRRCDMRFDVMLESGALEEVRALMARNLAKDLPIMRALGVPSLMSFLRGEIDMAAAIGDAKTQTRRFAKRQLTWFRNQFSHWELLDAQYMESQIDEFVTKILEK